MKRFALLAGLCLSLWPVAFLGWTFFGPHTDSASSDVAPATASTQTSDTTTSAPTSKQTDDARPAKRAGKVPPSSGSQNSGGSPRRRGAYLCAYYADTRATELARRSDELKRGLYPLRKQIKAGSASNATITQYNNLIPAVNARIRTYNRFLDRECVKR